MEPRETRLIFLLLIQLIWGSTIAQLSGTYTVPGSYTSIAQAVSDLNTQGVSGPTTIHIQAGFSETAPIGGYSLSATGTSVNTITFLKTGIGSNPLISAYSGGTSTPSSFVQDGIWRFIGCDYITVDGIDLVDLNTSNPSTMEYGFGFFKSSPSDGCQNNTIVRCKIALNYANNASGSGPSAEGSRGINMVNAMATFQIANLTPFIFAGSNSYNHFYENTISNCNIGIALMGYLAPSPYTLADIGNEIGGVLSVNGNTITNFGGAVAATNPAAAIKTQGQYDLLVLKNYINNNNGSGSNHTNSIRGINIGTALSANLTIASNSISLNGGGVSTSVCVIENAMGSTSVGNTISIQNNLIFNSGNLLNTSGSFYGIYNNSSASAILTIGNNTFSNVALNASTGSNYLIGNTGLVSVALSINDNNFSSCSGTVSSSGVYYSILNSAASSGSLNFSSNTFNNCVVNANTNAVYLIYNTGNSVSSINMNNNLISNCSYSFSASGVFYGLYNNSATCLNLSASSNTFINYVSNSTTGANHLIYNSGSAAISQSVVTIQSNLISGCNFSSTSGSPFYPIWHNGPTTTVTAIDGNRIVNSNWQSATSLRALIGNTGVNINSVTLSNNLISNCTSTTSSTGGLLGIYHNNTSVNSSGTVSILSNTISGFTTISGSGEVNFISNAGAISNTNSAVNLQNNTISGCSSTFTGNGVFYGVYNNSASSFQINISVNALTSNVVNSGSGAAYFIYNRGIAGSIFSSLLFSDNSISGNSHSATASSAAFYAIYNNGAAGINGNTLSIQNNTLTNHFSNTTSSPINLIINAATVSSLVSISGNLISQCTNTNTSSGIFTAIRNMGAGTSGNLSIASNTLINFDSRATSAARFLIYNSALISNTTSIQNNLIANTSHSASSSGANYFIYNNFPGNSAGLLISGNTFSNNTIATQNGSIFLLTNAGSVTQSISTVDITNNSINNFTSTSTSGAFFGIYNSGITCGNANINGNLFSGTDLSSPANTKYIISNDSPVLGSTQVSANRIVNLSSSQNSISSMYQIYNNGSSGGDLSIQNNSLTSHQLATVTGSIFSIYNSGVSSNAITISGNLISNVSFSTSLNATYFPVRNIASGSGTIAINSNSCLGVQQNIGNSFSHIFSNSGIATNQLFMNSNSYFGSSVTSSVNSVRILHNQSAAGQKVEMNTNSISSFSLNSVGSGTFEAIYNAGASNEIGINSNTLSNSSIMSDYEFRFINNAGIAVNSISMLNNNVNGGSISSSMAGNCNLINNTGASAGYLKMSGNTFSNNSTAAANSNVFLLNNYASVADSVVMSDNFLSQTFNTSTSLYSGTFVGIRNSGGTLSNTLSIERNDFSNITFPSQNGAGPIFYIYNSNNNSNLRVKENRWINLTLKHSGAQHFIYNISTTQNLLSVIGNSIVGSYQRTSAAGDTYFYLSGLNSLGNSVQTFSANNFSAISATVQGSGSFCGICSFDGSTHKDVRENVISSINYNSLGSMHAFNIEYLGNSSSLASSTICSNVFSNIIFSGPVTGIRINTSASAILPVHIFSNSIVSLSASSGVSGSRGAHLTGQGSTINFYKNKIANISNSSSGGITYGVFLNTSTFIQLSNNLIGNLAAPAANSSNAVTGIYIAGSSTANINFNTIFLNTSATGTSFGSSALFASTSTHFNLQNNILINSSVPGSSGLTVVLRRENSALANYSLSSNNNIFYAGTPANSNVVYHDGTNSFSILPTYQAYANPRESNSAWENSPFLSFVGSNSNFLHINPALVSISESGANNLVGISDDYDGQVRQGNLGYVGTGTAPDIGADEFEQSLTPCSSASAGIISSSTPSNICAGESVYLFSTGYSTGGNILHQWKVSSNSGGPYVNVGGGVGGNTSVFSSSPLTAGSYYYVLVTTCSAGSSTNTSNEILIQVNANPTASVTVNSQTLCAGDTLVLNGSSDIGNVFQWIGPNSFNSILQNSTIPSANTMASGSYSLITATANCTNVTSINITVNALPPAFSLAMSTNSICFGSSQTISASVPITTPTFSFGSQSTQNVNSGYPAPYSVYYGGQKMQILVLATELSASGFVAGTPIASIQFPVASLGSNWGNTISGCQNFQIAIGSSTVGNLSTFQSGLSTIYSMSAYSPSIGNGNVHTFSSPYVWDGISNIVIQTLFSNSIFGSTGDAVIQYNSPTGFQSTLVYRADNQSVANIAAATNSNVNVGFVRPDFRLNGLQVGNYVWSPSTGLSSSTGSVVVASPSLTTIYTASLTNGSCASTKNTTLNIMRTPTLVLSTSANTVCVGNSATISASGAQTYTWNTFATGSSIVIFPIITFTYVVTGSNTACPSSSNSIIIYSAPQFTFSAISIPTAICVGQSATYSASGATNYSWSNGNTNASFASTPTITSVLTVTANSGAGCHANRSVTVKVNTLPVLSATVSADSICLGTIVNIKASGATTYTWMPGNLTNAQINVSPSASTQYTLSGTNLNNCTNTLITWVIVDECTGIQKSKDASIDFSIFPNPSIAIFNLSFSSNQDRVIRLIDLHSKVLEEFTSDKMKILLDLTSKAKGLYFISITVANQTVFHKIVLE